MKILFLKIATVLKISTYQFWYEQECANIILSGPKQIKEIYLIRKKLKKIYSKKEKLKSKHR